MNLLRSNTVLGVAVLVLAAQVIELRAQGTLTVQDLTGKQACDPRPGSKETVCQKCLHGNATVEFQVCCCSPYQALVKTYPNPENCTCKTEAGWALILLAVLVPILIIGDIMLTLYCCYKGKCCCFKPSMPESKTQYNVHTNVLQQDASGLVATPRPVPQYSATLSHGMGPAPASPVVVLPTAQRTSQFPVAQYGNSPRAAPPPVSVSRALASSPADPATPHAAARPASSYRVPPSMGNNV